MRSGTGYEVADDQPRVRENDSPHAGHLTVHFQSLWIDLDRGTRLISMVPADDVTRERLERFSALLEAAPAWTAWKEVQAPQAS